MAKGIHLWIPLCRPIPIHSVSRSRVCRIFVPDVPEILHAPTLAHFHHFAPKRGG